MPLRTKAARQYAIRQIIRSQKVTTQEELGALLAERSYDVTQATLSRDLDELGAVKAPVNGIISYVVPDAAGLEGVGVTGDVSAVSRVALDAVLSIESSGNIVVVRTKPGAAQYLASAIDRAALTQVLGTVAGDDTIMVVSRSADGGTELAETLATFLSPA
ncbi:MAG: arginine repressor [Actinobacteria bacterium]|nr:arginine repressor [Actinomycetota bacterium]